MRAIKGFDANLRCRGFQFEVGKSYTHQGKVIACKSGFHAIPDDQHPLAVFEYYPPAGSRFCLVEYDGEAVREGDKLAAEILVVGKEISLHDLTLEAVRWVTERSIPEGPVSTKNNGLATASGYRGVATASGYHGAATTSGYQGAAIASGYQGAVMGKNGNAIFAVERETWDGPIISVAAGIVGQAGIMADVWYRCEGGKLVEVVQ